MLTRNKLTIGCAILILASTATAVGQTIRSGATAQPVPRKAPPSTLQLLNTRVPEVAFSGAPLEQVIDWLAEFTGTNVNVRWETLAASGIEKDKPISMRFKNLRLSQVLWMILNEAGGADIKLAYRATGNLIVISTHEELGKDMITKVYDVSDLLTRVPRFTNAANLNAAQALNQSGQGQGGGSSQMFQDQQGGNQQGGGEGDRMGSGGSDTEMQQIIDLIQDVIEPDSWVKGGGTGTVVPLHGQIIVRNSILVHQLLGGYVNEDDVR